MMEILFTVVLTVVLIITVFSFQSLLTVTR